MTIHKKELLARVGAVTSAVALVIAGSWYTVRRMEQSAKQVSSAASNGQVIILDAGHGEST